MLSGKYNLSLCITDYWTVSGTHPVIPLNFYVYEHNNLGPQVL